MRTRTPPVRVLAGKMILTVSFVPVFLASFANAMPASPLPVELNQPDGTKITLHVRGDEYFHWFADSAGFTVVRNVNAYEYATLNADGALTPTGWRVGRDDPRAHGLTPYTLPTAQAHARLRAANLPAPLVRGGPPSRVPPAGTVKNLVVLCKFNDHVFGTHTRAAGDYAVLWNTVGGDPVLAPTGSVRDCYFENSYGTMTLDSTVAAWVTLPNSEAYYANGTSGMGAPYPTNPQRMVEDALNALDALIDFGDFDIDNDGYIDGISVIHSGYGAETGGGGGNWIWSHRWSLWQLPAGQWASNDLNGVGENVKVYDYHTEPALWGTSGTDISRIGVAAHETGHFFGLPDLYDTSGGGQGIGSYCMMANSWGFDFTQLHPPHFSAWCKIFLGWVSPTVIAGPGVYAAGQVETSATVYRIDHNYPGGEYLLIENRQPVGFESVMPQGGLAIWHIDEAKSGNTDQGYPGQAGWPLNNQHYKVALLQADGNYELERNFHRGQGDEVYHAAGVSALTPHTVPDTDAYQLGAVGTTMNRITQVSAAGANMTFRYDNYPDCNDNQTSDGLDISTGTSADCNANGVPDECERTVSFIAQSPQLPAIGNGVPQSHVFMAPPFPLGEVTLEFETIGDFSSPTEWVDVDINGLWVGRVFVSTAVDCPAQPNHDSIRVPRDTFVFARDFDPYGNLDAWVNMTATADVNAAACAAGFIQVTLRFDDSCNGNGVPDDCDIAAGTSGDCDSNGVPDECDATGGGVLLDADFESGLPGGWSSNGIFQITDQCSSAHATCGGAQWAYAGDALTCTYGNNESGQLAAPAVTLGYGHSELRFCSRLVSEVDYDFAKVWVNEAEVWRESGGSGDWEEQVVDLDLFAGRSISLVFDFKSDTFVSGDLGWQVDNVQIISGTDMADADADGIPEICDNCPANYNPDQADQDSDGVGDACDIADCNGNLIDDNCELSCLLLGCEIPGCGEAADCNGNNVPDECDIAAETNADCNSNNVPDECDITAGTSADYNANSVPDACELDGAADSRYGPARAVQDTQTGFGDSDLALVDLANGSELDAVYGTILGGELLLVLTGNLESNWNNLDLFVDTLAGQGQNRLRGDNSDVAFNELNRMGDDGSGNGLTFDAGFAPDYWLSFTGGGSPYVLHANYAELLTSGGGAGYWLGFTSAVSDGVLAGAFNPYGIRVTINNANTAGVPGGTGPASGAGVTTGLELVVPLAAVGNPAGEVRVCAFINGTEHTYVSNQVLGGIGGGDNLAEPRAVNFGNLAGDQFFTVSPPSMGTETTVQNDSIVGNGPGAIVGEFDIGDQAGARLTSPCNGRIVAVQILWLEGTPGHGPSLQNAIYAYEDDAAFPTPGPLLAMLENPLLTPGIWNEFRYLNEEQTIPLSIPAASGQSFYVALEFGEPTNVGQGGPSVVRDTNGCQPGKNVRFEVPGPWTDFCLWMGGDLAIRAVIDCDVITGACCASDGTCSILTAAACTAGNGIYQGSDTSCTPNPCPQATGTCCAPDGSCTVTTGLECQGTYLGDNTDALCQPGHTPCPPPGGGACCWPWGCTEVESAFCQPQGGVYMGDGSTCLPDPCPGQHSTEACCLRDQSCIDLEQSFCEHPVEGSPGEPGGCSTNGCPPYEACCLTNGGCIERTPFACINNLGGTPQGPGSTCGTVACAGGECSSDPDCDDSDPCTIDVCDSGYCSSAPSVGDCFNSNGVPGCFDPMCCAAVCAEDPYCCDVAWNQFCADEAEILCLGQIDACPGAGDCFDSNGTVGCSDETCCEEICLTDPYCCIVEWNQYCAQKANVRCAGGQLPCPGEGSCFDSNGTVGCADPACCQTVCGLDPYCCEVRWNANCAATAAVVCTGQTGCPGTEDCFSAHGTPGCSDPACCADICDRDPYCCATGWNDRCACEANVHCAGGSGVCPGTGDCFSPNGTPGCDDEECCAAVCAANDYCCCQEWNQGCADLAGALCGAQPACGPGRGDCFSPNGTLGCDDVPCCEAVCAIDPFCCTNTWNQRCADEAFAMCLPDPGDCNADDAIDALDFIVFGGCVGGPGAAIGPACYCADLNFDGAVDLFDYAQFTLLYPEPTGACCRPDTSCLDGIAASDCVSIHGGSFKGSASLCAQVNCTAAAATVVINEVLGSTISDDDEFIELYNPGASPVNISGWRIELWDSDAGAAFGTADGASPMVIPTATTLAAGGYYLLANALFSSSWPLVSPDLVFANDGIENSSYTIILKNAALQTINAILVTDGGAGDAANDAGNALTPDLTVGPDGSFLPAGFYRTTDGGPVVGFLEFSPKPAASATPGASNVP